MRWLSTQGSEASANTDLHQSDGRVLFIAFLKCELAWKATSMLLPKHQTQKTPQNGDIKSYLVSSSTA